MVVGSTCLVAQIVIPLFSSQQRKDIDDYAAKVQNVIAELALKNPRGWIVDLRGNGGGNMWAMLAGVGPILGEGEPGASLQEDGTQGSVGDERRIRFRRLKIAEIHHHRQVRQITRLYRLLHGYEVRLPPVRRLDSHHHIRVLAPCPRPVPDSCRTGSGPRRHPRPAIPAPTMLISARTRVWALSMIRRRNSGKSRQPEVPASTMVVTPVRNPAASGCRLWSPFAETACLIPQNTSTWISTSPGEKRLVRLSLEFSANWPLTFRIADS